MMQLLTRDKLLKERLSKSGYERIQDSKVENVLAAWRSVLGC